MVDGLGFDKLTYILAHKWWDSLTITKRQEVERSFRARIDRRISNLVFKSEEDKIYAIYTMYELIVHPINIPEKLDNDL